jgi:hypothetical protein
MCRGAPATARAGGPIAATNSNVVTTTIMGVCYIEVWGLLFGLAWPCDVVVCTAYLAGTQIFSRQERILHGMNVGTN